VPHGQRIVLSKEAGHLGRGIAKDIGLKRTSSRGGFRFFLVSVLFFPAAFGQVEIPAGAQFSIRLRDTVSSKHAQVGDPIPATLIAPVEVNGKELLPSGFLVQGTVGDPSPAKKRLNHSVLLLNFGQLKGKAHRSLTFEAKVLDVDNGRETVDSEGVIHGLRPLRRRPSDVEELLMLAAYAHPAVLASLEVGRLVIAEEEKPRINYEPGVELMLSLTSPLRISKMPEPEIFRQPAVLRSSTGLKALVNSLPLRTATPRGTASDLINFTFLGTEGALKSVFLRAGWLAAENLDIKTDVQTFFAVAYHHSYREGPVSSLTVNGQKPALVFEKETNTFSKRHHIRIWQTGRTYRGTPVWIGAGTHDIGIVFSRKARTFSHSVDPDIDAERQKIVNDLIFTGEVGAAGLIPRPRAPKTFQNATGDHLHTDGAIAAIRLGMIEVDMRQ
jgi:hypothetical protein